ncbi:Uncharacterised protein [Vibrio cholerae]|nr:Uncharacterised protein [Vibrio cholerae]
MSSKQSGCSRLISSFIPRDSSWNTAVVLASCRLRKERASSSGIASIRTGGLPAFFKRGFTKPKAQSIMVRVRSPKKSNLTRPAVSTSFLSN